MSIRSTIRRHVLRESKELEPSGEKVPSRRGFFSRIGKEIVTAPIKQALAQQAIIEELQKNIDELFERCINLAMRTAQI